MTQCDSSLIRAYDFDFDASILTIVFKSTNEVRHYTGFPPELFWEFEESESKGKFFNSRIKAQFEVLKSGKVSDEQIAAAVSETSTHINEDGDTTVVKTKVTGYQYVGSDEVLPEGARVISPDLGITDDDIRSVDPAYSPVRDENLTREEEEALAEPAKKKTAVDGVLSQWNALVTTQPAVLKIADAKHYTTVAETLKKKVGIRDTVFGILDPIREIVYKAYKDVMERQKAILAPIDESIKADKTALLAYDQEQQRIAREAQQKAQREAEEAQERERQRQTEELRLQVASDHAETGNIEEAEASLFDETIQAPVTPVYAPYVPAATPVTAGLSGRKNWKARLISLEALVLDVAEGIKCQKEKGNLMGHAPLNVLEAKLTALNQAAKASERVDLYPGVEGFNDAVMNVRR